MARPEGYRKALRLMKLAEKFQLPVFTFIDTPGAYPGIGAEERGQSEAIGHNIFEMAQLEVPIISTIIGEGGSGGALAISVADQVLMLQYSVYARHCASDENAIVHERRIRASMPDDGEVRIIKITDAQLGRMQVFHGRARRATEVAPEQLTIL